jgi:hypothetical protein
MEGSKEPSVMNNARPCRYRLIIILVTFLVALLGSIVAYLHFSVKATYAEMKAVTARITPPANAMQLEEWGEGDGLGAYACFDTHCPAYHRAYAAALRPGGELPTLRQLLESSGYRVTSMSDQAACTRQGDWQQICYAESVSRDVLITVGIEFPTNTGQDWVPKTMPPPGTEWRRLTVGAADY